ncbi:hypothetical protein X805_30730 [Sphaerotilus natans subsp. natans DSM 6575]|uniref:DNA-binding protein H-NS-like C-terminal domain-containing protein n=1 Tax=Sphaerotilus natans subsp. natans DSM 6575 TaxID=1286631 RepID=A0A059KIQ4_9BURK|nr:H-NS histone family protein [Sphaerotilus natans]KDB51352.1 hypothetical protein X805_30730 [Sphaerotilus natans subsp. natans DSM 6575]SIR68658.1 H-NS histone family protein [Sphaerotilus natans]
MRDQVIALGTRLGSEQPRLPPDHLPLELLTLCGVENPHPRDVLPWQLDELARDFWDAYYAAREAAASSLTEAQRQAESAARRRQSGPGVRYRHPKTGETWSGRGLQPKWIRAELEAGKTLSEFEVKEA